MDITILIIMFVSNIVMLLTGYTIAIRRDKIEHINKHTKSNNKNVKIDDIKIKEALEKEKEEKEHKKMLEGIKNILTY